MITDNQTNFVYFSELLKTKKEYKNACSCIIGILERYQIPYGFLKGTKDIWCRDYMPVQKRKDEFVQLRFEPSYLRKYPELKTEFVTSCKENNLHPDYCSIMVDGGNVVKWHDKVIMTTRILKENWNRGKEELVRTLRNFLEVDVILIPDVKSDLTGHADGHVRFYDDNTILVNELANEYKYWREGFLKMIKRTGLKYIEIPWFIHKDKRHPDNAIGCYINFLEVKNIIILPVFEVPGNRDQETLDLLRSLYPQKAIEPININEIGLRGGLMNCITWNIRK